MCDSESIPTDISHYVTERWGPRLLLLHPNNRFLYMAHWDLHRISGYAIAEKSGALRPLPGSPWPTGERPRAITIDPAGRFLYSGNWKSGDITGYAINVDSGVLTPLPGSPYRVGQRPRNLRLDPTGRFGYVSNRDSCTISAFTVNSDTGDLQPLGASPIATGPMPRTTVIDYNGTFACAGHQHTDTVSAFAIDPGTRQLRPLTGGPVRAGDDPRSVTFHPKGPWIYVANRGSHNVTVLALDTETKSLHEITGSPFPSGALPFAMQFHPCLRFGYVACPGSNEIWVYTVDSATGAITPVQQMRIDCFPVWPSFDPQGNFLFINAYDSNNMHAFAVNPTNGMLTPAPGGPWTVGASTLRGTHPREALTDLNGEFLFVPNCRSDSISVFSIAPQSGSLTPVADSPFPPSGALPLRYHWIVRKMAAKSLIGRHRAHPTNAVRRSQLKTDTLTIDCPRAPVIILGVARSGTTMITEMLAGLGLFVGAKTDGKVLEAKYFVRANDTIIKRAHGYWDHPAAMTYLLRSPVVIERIARCLKGDLRSRRVAKYLGWTRALHTKGLDGFDEPWGWKDPRTTFTLPIWLCLFPDARIILIQRNGVDVAASLRTMERGVIARREEKASRRTAPWRYPSQLERFGFKGAARCLHLDGGFSLWEEYMKQAHAMLDGIGCPHMVLRYEDVLANPHAHLATLQDFCQLPKVNETVLHDLATRINPARACAFVKDSELVSFYHRVRETPWMVRQGYDQLDV
jgi:6-phosphogluconolactonase